MFYGFDTDQTMLRIASMNLMLHGIEDPNMEYKDSLSKGNAETEQYTMVLANPPFKGSLDYSEVADNLLTKVKTKKTELLFLALMLRLLKNGGTAQWLCLTACCLGRLQLTLVFGKKSLITTSSKPLSPCHRVCSSRMQGYPLRL